MILPLLSSPPHAPTPLCPLPHAPLANFGHVTSQISTLLFLQPLAIPNSLAHISSRSVLATRSWPLAGIGQFLRRRNHPHECVLSCVCCREFKGRCMRWMSFFQLPLFSSSSVWSRQSRFLTCFFLRSCSLVMGQVGIRGHPSSWKAWGKGRVRSPFLVNVYGVVSRLWETEGWFFPPAAWSLQSRALCHWFYIYVNRHLETT